jgi:hypothetical protein
MDSSPDAKFFQMRKENSAGHGRRGSFSRSISTTEFDDNEVSFYSVVDRNSSVMFNESHNRSVIDSKVLDRKKMTTDDMQFVNRASWDKGSSFCKVCGKDTKQKGGRHHCRVCGAGVCGTCSQRKINDKRTCDMCFYQAKTSDRSRMREDTLIRNNELQKQRKDELGREKLKFEERKAEVQYKKNEIARQEQEEERHREAKIREKTEAEATLETAKDLKKSLNTNIERNRQIISGKESALSTLQTKLSVLKLELNQKQQTRENLRNEYQTKLSQRETLKDQQMNEGSMISSTPTASVIARNYSIAASTKDGKYNISGQPVKI